MGKQINQAACLALQELTRIVPVKVIALCVNSVLLIRILANTIAPNVPTVLSTQFWVSQIPQVAFPANLAHIIKPQGNRAVSHAHLELTIP
jgi:collagenase-like PrtC family protease